jgi:hypothetical protein
MAAFARKGDLANTVDHAAQCHECAETLAIIAMLADAPELRIPSSSLIYWKAQLRDRYDRRQRALKPLRWVEGSSIVALVAAAVAGVSLLPAWAGAVGAMFGAAAIASILLLRRSYGSAKT